MCENKKKEYIYDLVNVLNNPTRFQIRYAQNFHLQEKQVLRWLTFKCKTREHVLVKSLKSSSHTKHIVLHLINVCCNHTSFKLQWTRITAVLKVVIIESTSASSLFIMVRDRRKESKTRNLKLTFLTRLSPWNKIKVIKSKQGYNRAKFKRSCFNAAREKANFFLFFSKWTNVPFISLQYVWSSKRWYIHNLLDVLNNYLKFQLNQMKT